MDRTKIKQGTNYNYKTHNSEGRFKVGEVYQLPRSKKKASDIGKPKGGGSWFVIGEDKTKGKQVTVRPSQVFK